MKGSLAMLITNSKKAMENIHTYIMDNFIPEDYTDKVFHKFPQVASFILETFRKEKRCTLYRCSCEQEIFLDWTRSLPSVLDCCYFYNRSAIEDLGNILEQTEEERRKYSEDRSEEMLSKLIYRELIKGERKYKKERGLV